MNQSPIVRGLRLWAEGLLLLALRWAQLQSGFDPATGLSQKSLPGLLLPAAILLLAALEAVFALRLPKGKQTYAACFAAPGYLPLLAGGGLLMAAGAVLLPGWSVLHIAAAVGGVATAAGLVLFARIVRGGGAVKCLPLIPAMLFGVLFLLAIYLPEGSNPVLARYYLPVLAAAAADCAIYQLAGIALGECGLRWFSWLGGLAVPLCLAALADCTENPGWALVFLGWALVLTVFLLLRRTPEAAAETP